MAATQISKTAASLNSVAMARNGTEKNAARKRIRTRRRILKAARVIFAKKGFESANVSDIVAKIDMAQGTFYYHFPDKKSILLELIGEFFGEVKQLAASMAQLTVVGPETTGLLARRLAGLLYANRDLALIIMNEHHNSDPEIRDLIRNFYNYLYEQTALGLELGVRLGLVRPLDTRITSIALTGMLKEVVFHHITTRETIEMDRLIDELTTLQNIGIRPLPPASPGASSSRTAR